VQLQGIFSVLPTPFKESGDVDADSLRRVVDLFLSAGVNGVTALGVTGEVARLNERERGLVLDTVLAQVNGRALVIVGTSADGLRTCIEHTERARSAGAAAVMVSPPRLAKLNSEGVIAHFKALASAVDIEIVVQDYPPISGFTMEPALLARIAREIPCARNIKLEDPPTPLKTTRILELTKSMGFGVGILGGLGGGFLLEELMAGASGAMTGFAYPEMLIEVVQLYNSRDKDAAADAFYRYVPLMRFEFQEGIGMAIRKEVLRRRGALQCAAVRPPAAKMDSSTNAALEYLLRWMRDKQKVKWISVGATGV
jgi:4-hydroxy-tetrahydrodipicolinate synthase